MKKMEIRRMMKTASSERSDRDTDILIVTYIIKEQPGRKYISGLFCIIISEVFKSVADDVSCFVRKIFETQVITAVTP